MQRSSVRAGIVALASAVLVGSVYAGWAYYLADRSGGPMLVAGRRGDVANWPENSLPAIRSAARLDADGIEFDVRQSADGTFYLMHDAEVDRTTNGMGALRGLHDADIDALLITGGLGFHGEAGLRVPRLADVLEALADYSGIVLLDAKGDAAEHAALARLVAAGPVDARIHCSTSDDVTAVAGLVPTYGAGAGVDQGMLPAPLPWSAWFWPVEVSAIYEWWTADERDAMDRARRWGVEIYITNDLQAALAYRRGRP